MVALREQSFRDVAVAAGVTFAVTGTPQPWRPLSPEGTANFGEIIPAILAMGSGNFCRMPGVGICVIFPMRLN